MLSEKGNTNGLRIDGTVKFVKARLNLGELSKAECVPK
jgi:hypothetical protein